MRSERFAASAMTRSSSASSIVRFWSMLSTSRILLEAMRSDFERKFQRLMR